jgi:chromosome segregation ATPase
MISYEKDNMKLITEELENHKAYTEKQNSLEKEKNQNRRIVDEEAKRYMEEKIKLEAQIENIQQMIWEDIQDQKDKIEDSLSGHIKHREEKNQIKEQEKTIRHLEEKLDRVNKEHAALRELFEMPDG